MIKNNRKYLDFAKKTSLGLNTNMSSMTFASVDHFNERFSPLFGSRRIFKNRKNAQGVKFMRKNIIRKSSQISFNTSMASMNFAQADNLYERMTPLFGSRTLKKNKKRA